jgi:cell wall-associated NlpC family hydrolase
MTAGEFVRRIVGTPWVRWRSDFGGCDCYGCIVLWHREVLGIELGGVPETDIATGFSAARGWVECTPEAGATCFMAWRRGAPTHCGILLAGGMVLHSEGCQETPGNVRMTRMRALERIYGEIRFYRYEPCH